MGGVFLQKFHRGLAVGLHLGLEAVSQRSIFTPQRAVWLERTALPKRELTLAKKFQTPPRAGLWRPELGAPSPTWIPAYPEPPVGSSLTRVGAKVVQHALMSQQLSPRVLDNTPHLLIISRTNGTGFFVFPRVTLAPGSRIALTQNLPQSAHP